jgi:chorismate-pyruvate lyase
MKPIPDYQSLYGRFPDADGIPLAETIPSYEIPEPYRALLVHHHHMTVTVESHYGDRVDVRVLDSRLAGAEYSRKILLELAGNRKVVQFGIVGIDLDLLSPAVRDQITAQGTPLGRVLIENNVLREVHPTGYLRIAANGSLKNWFGMERDEPLFGRLGVITADGRPAIEVLEILAPVPVAR